MRRGPRVRHRAAVLAVALAIVPLAAACEITSTVAYVCTNLGHLPTSIHSTIDRDSVSPGDWIQHDIDVVLPQAFHDRNPELRVLTITVDYELPAQISAVGGAIVADDGNVPGTVTVDGRSLRVSYDTAVAGSTPIDLPTISFSARVAPRELVGTVAWPAPQRLGLALRLRDLSIPEPCTPATGSTPINNTDVRGPVAPTTTSRPWHALTTSTTPTTNPSTEEP